MLHPTDLQDLEKQKEAQQALSLIEQLDAVKVQSYMDEQKRKYLASHPVDNTTSTDEKIARWAETSYYKHLRDYIVEDSLDAQKFAHRFQDSTFIPLFPPQSIQDANKKKIAFDAVARMRVEFLPTLDQKLWSAWAEVKEVVELTGGNMLESFSVFLEEDYYRIMRETCEASSAVGQGSRGSSDLPFTPFVRPTFEASAAEAEQRKKLLRKASSIDHDIAVQVVIEEYKKFKDSVGETQREVMPLQAPPRYAASKYYRFLEERLRDGATAESKEVDVKGGTADAGQAQRESSSAATSVATSSSLCSGLDMLLSGQAFTSNTAQPEELVYKSSLQILQSAEEGGRCNYQGVLVMCDDSP